MSWWGKILGGTFGFMLGGPLGAMLGAAFGHQFDHGLGRFAVEADDGIAPADNDRIQSAFFTATFSVMGHLAKADGHVSAHEIEMARKVMQRMELTPELKEAAISLFNAGKQPHFDLDAVLDQFRNECQRRRNLLQMFLEIQFSATYADGLLHPAEHHVLQHICARLGFSRLEFLALQARVRAANEFADKHRAQTHAASHDALNEAYGVLGLTPQANDEELKKAYRRLMNQHHPDKLVSKGLPEEMLRLATQKTQEIKAAYERIREARGSAR
jgi:DnaJ like chaperone protein